MIINASAHQIPLANKSVHACVTSPPYFGLRKYAGAQDVAWPAGAYAPMTGCPPCIEVPAMTCPLGNEPTIEGFIWHLLLVMREVRRVLRDDGTCWVNLGDSYSSGSSRMITTSEKQQSFKGNLIREGVEGIDAGNLLAIPHRFALAAQADGWTLRNDCVWAKKSAMPESVSGWHFVRHRVKMTYEQYEAMQQVHDGATGRPISQREGMQIVREEGVGCLQADPGVSAGTGTIQTDGQIQANGTTARREAGDKSYAEQVCMLRAGQSESEALLLNREGQALSGEANPQIQANRKRQRVCQAKRSKKGAKGVPQGKAARSVEGLPQDAEGQIPQQNPPVFTSAENVYLTGEASNLRAMGERQGDTEGAVLLVQEEGKANSGSCNSTEQGWCAHENQHRRSLPAMQSKKRGENCHTVLVDCPGCEDCQENGGYVLRRGSWRHTRAQEMVFMFTKGMGYWSDSEIVKEPAIHVGDDRKARAQNGHKTMPNELQNGIRPGESSYDLSGRNPRSVFSPSPSPYSGAHFATFPKELIRPLILSSVPRRCCPECGQGWAAVVETRSFGKALSETKYAKNTQAGSMSRSRQAYRAEDLESPPAPLISGYRPTCQCGREDYKPGIVLDPFVGSGTTLEVARECGVKAIGLDISHEYLDEQASWRGLQIAKPKFEDMPLFAEVSA